MKSILALIIVACSCMYSVAQDYGKYDYELNFTVPTAGNNIDGYTNSGYAPYVSFECRRQLNKLPIDVGLHAGVSAVIRTDNSNSAINYFRAVPILAISNYQFGRGKKINPYAGIGAGISMNAIAQQLGKNDINFALAPRVGVRIFKFLNVSACYYATQNEYSSLNFNVGFYL